MLEFRNVLDAAYGAYVVNGAYGGFVTSGPDTTQRPDRDQAIATIRELLAGDTAAVRRSAGEASTAVSTIQIFKNAIDTIADKLAKMSELAKKSLDPDSSQGRIEQMQKQFRDLVEEINQTAKGTEYQFNKPFSGSGKTLSIPAGNGSKIDIFARDFRIDAEGLNIATEPKKALSTIKEAISDVAEYKTYLDRQTARLIDITTTIESDIRSAMGVDMKDFQPELAAPMAENAAGMISTDRQTSLDAQANLSPGKIMKLLDDSN